MYDVSEKKCSKLKKICDNYLNHIQNSVYEGELSNLLLKELKHKLDSIIDRDKDSIIIYTINNPKWLVKDIIGIEKNNCSNFI